MMKLNIYKIKLKSAGLVMAGCLLVSSVCMADEFVIKAINIKGLHYIQRSTVLHYLPLKAGQTFTSNSADHIVRRLYATGFFQNVTVERINHTLLITVSEQPIIKSIKVTGVEGVSKDKLQKMQKKLGLVAGKILQPVKLEQFKDALLQAYDMQGNPHAIIDVKVKPVAHQQVMINITAHPGQGTRVKRIQIIGNHAFSTRQLRHQLKLTTTSLWAIFTKTNQYTEEKFNRSLIALHNFYLNRGYLEFQILSSSAHISKNKQYAYITITLKEGPLYRFSGFRLTGNFKIPRKQLVSKITFKKGDVFSKKMVTVSVDALGNAMGDAGYGFPKINAIPMIDKKNRQIFMTFNVRSGRQVYVQKINFHGNTKTADYVLRRAMRQHEGSRLSLSKIHESERKLRMLGYLKNIAVKTTPVLGANDQVDLNWHVDEAPSAEAMASLGYGTDGPEFNASFNQYNFMGTGRSVGINFNTSYWGRSYALKYYDPYYTEDGLGRGINVYYQRVAPNSKLNISNYQTDTIGGAVTYNKPLDDNSSVQFGYGYQYLHILSLGDSAASQIQNFTTAHGMLYRELRLTGGWNRNTYDRAIFPTHGLNQQASVLISVPAAAQGLTYYKTNYSVHYLHPLPYGFIASFLGNLGYGNTFDTTGFPFFENYYVGGIAQPGQVRGYDSYTLGPKDMLGDALGGNALISGSAALILPYPLSRQSVRSSVFIDGGNVYAHNTPSSMQGTSSGRVRYSAGLGIDWRSPFGTLSFSVAQPINPEAGDSKEFFQFTIYSGF